jgi:hypothetical protein
MPISEQDKKRLKEIDDELVNIHGAIKEYHGRTDERGITWQVSGKPYEYQTLVDRESILLKERKSIVGCN